MIIYKTFYNGWNRFSSPPITYAQSHFCWFYSSKDNMVIVQHSPLTRTPTPTAPTKGVTLRSLAAAAAAPQSVCTRARILTGRCHRSALVVARRLAQVRRYCPSTPSLATPPHTMTSTKPPTPLQASQLWTTAKALQEQRGKGDVSAQLYSLSRARAALVSFQYYSPTNRIACNSLLQCYGIQYRVVNQMNLVGIRMDLELVSSNTCFSLPYFVFALF